MAIRIGRRAGWVRLLLVAPLLAVAIGLARPTPVGAAFERGGAITGGSIDQNVVVPAGAFCDLRNVVVKGSVTVGAGAILIHIEGEIRGTVEATGHQTVLLSTIEIRGSVTLTGAAAAGGITSIRTARVRGDVTMTGNGGDRMDLFNSTVRGSATINDNHVDSFIFVAQNAIRVDLACTGNTLAPTNIHPVTGPAGPSTAGGVKSGQCAGL